MRPIIQNKYSRVDIHSINAYARHHAEFLVASAEEYYNQQVSLAAAAIREKMPQYQFILLCGPSASGKTTTAYKLKHCLLAQGVGAQVLSMDNFYTGIESYHVLPDGLRNMESIQAIDLDLLNRCFEELMEKREAMFPIFDFATQQQQLNAHLISLGCNDVLIMEGIHALNPLILKGIAEENIFRIYVSVRTKFICGEEVILEPKDLRLIRRIVRDYKFRNYPPEQTLQYWKHVIAGERVNINPYRDNVHLKMDNTIDYEVCVWHNILHDLVNSAPMQAVQGHPELARIFSSLIRVAELDHTYIPSNSLLREFIGSSIDSM